MRVLVTGSRTWDDVDEIHDALDAMWLLWYETQTEPFILVHGACPRGADRLADEWAASSEDVFVERHPADWSMGRHAGPLRNQHMVNLGADHVLAFIKDNSPGASHLVRQARKAGIPVQEFHETTEVNVTEETTPAEVGPPTLVERLVAVKREIGAVGKGDRNAQQGFNFRGIDAVLNAVAGPLMKHGIMAYPSKVIKVEKGTATSNAGKTINTVSVIMQYAFTDGEDVLHFEAPGEAFDSGDKATPKAMSVAYRTALIQALSLPTDEPDPDSESYEAAPPPVPQLSDDDLAEAIKAETDIYTLKAMWPAQGLAMRSADLQVLMKKRAAELQEPSA